MNNASAPAASETLKGNISVKLQAGKTLRALCEKMFETFNADDHEPIAIRLFHGTETILTLYALDKVRQETSDAQPDKLPVRKFKEIVTSPEMLLPFLAELNFTLNAGNFPIDDMEVVNQ